MHMRITFTHSAEPGSGGEQFAVGETYDLPDESAYRWMRRNVAVAAEAETADAPPKRRRGRPKKNAESEVSDGSDAIS